MIFDRIMPMSKGFVVGIEMLPSVEGSLAVVAVTAGKKIKTKDLHKLLAHVGEDCARQMAKFYGWEVVGKFDPCAFCTTAKARQNNLNRHANNHSTVPGERLFIDISSVKGMSYSNSKYWLLILDNCSDVVKSQFLTAKSHTAKTMVPFIQDLKAKHKITVKYICCDNAGVYKALEKACLRAGLGIQFEYTAPRTLQQNGRVEQKFATLLYGRVRSMLNHAGLFEQALRHGIWARSGSYSHFDQQRRHHKGQASCTICQVLWKRTDIYSTFEDFWRSWN
jgi:hypothetical protein